MDTYLLLLITYIAYVVVGRRYCKLPIISPGMITLLSLTVVIALGYWYRHEMGTDLYVYTYMVIALGGGTILGTAYGVQRWAERRWGSRIVTGGTESLYTGAESYTDVDRGVGLDRYMDANSYILVGRIKRATLYKYTSIYMVCFIIFSLVCVFLITSGDSDMGRMAQYRDMLLYPNLYSYDRRIIFINSQFYKIAWAITYVSAYVAIFNGVSTGRPIFKGTGLLTTVALFCVGSSIAMGARQPAIEVGIFMILTYLFFMVKANYTEAIKRFLYKLIPIIVASPFLYMIYGSFVGRSDGNNISLQRVTELLAGGIYAMNVHIWEPARTTYFGQSSFAEIYDKLISFGVVPESARMAFHSFDKFGNTLTLFGRWYEDFGLLGVIIMSAIVMTLFTAAYEYVQRQSNGHIMTHVWTAIFLTELVSLVWAGYDDRIRPLLAFAQFIIIGLIGLFIAIGYSIKKNTLRTNR